MQCLCWLPRIMDRAALRCLRLYAKVTDAGALFGALFPRCNALM